MPSARGRSASSKRFPPSSWTPVAHDPAQPTPFDRLDWIPVVVRDLRRVSPKRLAALVDFCEFEQIHYYRREPQGWRIDDIVDVTDPNYHTCSIAAPATATP